MDAVSFAQRAHERLAVSRGGEQVNASVVNADPLGWIQRNFYIPELNAPIILYPSQSIPLAEALRRDDAGLFVYSTVLWSAIKKSAKSSIAAAVGMWFAWRRPGASVKVLGNDLDQAQSRVFEYMRQAVLLNPQWRASIEMTQTRIILPNGSVIKAIPIDPQGEAGGGDDLLLYGELWGWRSKKHQQMWSETTLSPLLYGQSMRFCESYAGYDGESPVLENLYQQGVKNGRVLDADLEMYANDGARQFTLWNTRPTLPWQTPAYYAQERASLTANEFSRLHENAWGSSTGAFVPLEWWDACQDAALPPLEQDQMNVVAIDAAVTSDCFAVVMVSRSGDHCHVRYAQVWTPPKGGRIDFAEPEAELRRLAKAYNVVEFAYDPYQLEDMAARLRKDGVGHFRAFSQQADRLVADKQLYDLIMNRRIHHSGEAVLREHVGNANQKTDGESGKLRIVKRAEHMKIDATVACSMACARALYLTIG